MSFSHLHVHSEYSLLEASCRVKDIAAKAAEFKMPAVALTDNGNMFAAIEFYFACKDKGVKPLIGMDAYVAPGSRFDKKQDRDQVFQSPRRLVLLAMNLEGYRNLCKLSSLGFQEGFYWKPRIDYEILKEYSDHLICLTGGIRGEVSDTFLKEGEEAAQKKIQQLKDIFGDRLYLEINRTGVADWKKVEAFLIESSQKFQIPLVAANDVHYVNQEDQIAQEVLICIGSNRTLADETRFRLGTSEFYLKSPEEMTRLFKDLPEAIENTQKIVDRCSVSFKLKDEFGKPIYHLPTFPTSEGVSLQDEIAIRTRKGLEVRFEEAVRRGEPVPEEKKPDYFGRLEFELGVIDKMGFNGYFLIVQDFINWAKNNEIPVGPGRGSGAGSLVAYSLRITDLDPIPNYLLFERFLNPERVSMPDFDIDFCQDRRQEVIEYVTQKYGQQSVSQIITYGKLQARAALKDVGRVLGMTFPEVDAVSKLIPEKLGINLKTALEMEPRLVEMMDSDPTVGTLLDLAQRVEGLVRHAGIHAAGVIIADGQLVTHAPLYKGAAGEQVVQYDMKHAEKIGLIKFDFLGLKTLTHIQHAIKLIKGNRGVSVDTALIPMNDPPTFEMLSRGETAGVFQFEGEGITDATRKIKPSSFADITAITSLYRPGPMANIPDFTDRKHGKAEVSYLLPETKEVLAETYGIMVYQEQVMGIASKIAGYSLGEADMLRRAMGKKIKAEMDQHRERFLSGAKERGHDEQRSSELFDLMYKFADYGFNKSHAAAYSVITIQTAWIKCHYPVEFYAALLSTELSDTDKIVKYSKEAAAKSVPVRPPHINFSDYLFRAVGDEVYFGLGGIKGVGESAVQAILEAREKMPEKKFLTLDDFFNNVDSKKINKKTIECLIKAGGFDGFGFHRNQLMVNYPTLIERSMGQSRDREIGQSSLFDLMEDQSQEGQVQWAVVEPWSRTQQLAYEKEVLGFYLSDHPLKGLETLAQVWGTQRVQDLPETHRRFMESPPKTEKGKVDWKKAKENSRPKVQVVGIVSSLREVITKKGTRMAFGRFEDLTGSVEIVIFPDAYKNCESDLKLEGAVILSGSLEVEEENPKILVDSAQPITASFNKVKKMHLQLQKASKEKLESLQQVFKGFPGETQVDFGIDIPELDIKVTLRPKVPIAVKPCAELFDQVGTVLGSMDVMHFS